MPGHVGCRPDETLGPQRSTDPYLNRSLGSRQETQDEGKPLLPGALGPEGWSPDTSTPSARRVLPPTHPNQSPTNNDKNGNLNT